MSEVWAGIDSRRVLDVLVRNLDGMVFRCAIDSYWTMSFVSAGCHGAHRLRGR